MSGAAGIFAQVGYSYEEMKIRLLALFFALVALAWAQSEMKTTSSTSAPNSGAACKLDGAKSACGLPSNVVIDMAKTKVQHTDAEWRQLLTPQQYKVTRGQGTEPPF